MPEENLQPIVWNSQGAITTRMRLNHICSEPGLYKLTFKIFGREYSYIGESGNIRNRIREYTWNPKEGQYNEFWFFDLIKDADEVELWSFNGLGLETPPSRRRHERAALQTAR